MNYRITNLEYGIGPWGTEVLYGGIGNPNPGGTEDNVHSVTLLEGADGRRVLVDTGVDEEDPAKKELWDSLITEFNGTMSALRLVGLSPEDIDAVIVTHAHLDHIGALTRFAHADIYMQREEFEAWERMAADPDYLQLVLPAAFPPDYPKIRELIDQGKVHMLEGDVDDVLPGISLHVVRECHSVAEQMVVVDTARGKVIVGGDIACRPENVFGTKDWPGYLVPSLGRSGSARMVCEAYGWIRRMLDGDASRLVLTHDVTMHDRFETEGRRGLAVHYVAR